MVNETVLKKSKYFLAVSQMYHPKLHGNESESVYGHDILVYTCDLDNESDEKNICEEINICKEIIDNFKDVCRIRSGITHPIIRNYEVIIKKNRDISTEIVTCFILKNGQMAVTHHTFWLRIFQKKFKNYYKNKILLTIKNLAMREILGSKISSFKIKLNSSKYLYESIKNN